MKRNTIRSNNNFRRRWKRLIFLYIILLSATQVTQLAYTLQIDPHESRPGNEKLSIRDTRDLFGTDLNPMPDSLQPNRSRILLLAGRNDSLPVQTAAVKSPSVSIAWSKPTQGKADPEKDGYRTRQAATGIGFFIQRTDAGTTENRHQIGTDPFIPEQRPFQEVRVPPVDGLSLAVLMLVIAAATLVSEDLTCIGAGLLAARGVIDLPLAIFASFAGILIGDILLFLAGKYLGRPALKHPPLKWMIKEDDVTRSSRWFAAKGPVIIIASRFLPGSRLPTYFSAGVLDTSFWRFTLYFSVAAALWTPLLVGLSAIIGERMFDYYDLFSQYGILILVGTVILLWLLIKLVIPLFSYRGRRMLRSSIYRKMRWEFWPPYVFYIPIVLYYVFLGFRFRSLTLFTAANPAIPEGGFIGESKTQILDNLARSEAFVARYRLIKSDSTPENRLQQAFDFMHEIDVRFPIVMKPDTGERGTGVAIIGSEKQLSDYLDMAVGDVIIQEYVDGHEYGVFYYRYPDELTGHIFSITDKQLLKLTGDGKSTLEKLILSDERAVCMAKFHMRNHKDRLYQVPEKGEEVPLVQVGTHCRGALFLNGESIRTPELEAAIDRISKTFSGFYFGRYDIRTPSVADFKKGKRFKIVELNGVTSEATHIYDPGNSLWYAYGVLMHQWRIAFEIGSVNRNRGIQPATPRQLLARLLN